MNTKTMKKRWKYTRVPGESLREWARRMAASNDPFAFMSRAARAWIRRK